MYSSKDSLKLRNSGTSLSLEGMLSNVEKRFFHKSTFQYLNVALQVRSFEKRYTVMCKRKEIEIHSDSIPLER